MKIICESQEEYDNLMKASKYLHDYYVYIKKPSKKTKIKDIDIDGNTVNYRPHQGESFVWLGLDNDFQMINYLQHLYLSEDDWANKKEFVWIEK